MNLLAAHTFDWIVFGFSLAWPVMKSFRQPCVTSITTQFSMANCNLLSIWYSWSDHDWVLFTTLTIFSRVANVDCISRPVELRKQIMQVRHYLRVVLYLDAYNALVPFINGRICRLFYQGPAYQERLLKTGNANSQVKLACKSANYIAASNSIL